jgi:hypothetical protein
MTMQNLSTLFATQLAKKTSKEFSLKQMGRLSSGSADSPKSILQLNSIPLKIDINKYKNAHSADNPTGDYKAAYLFTILANTIPELSAYYNNSPYLITDIWDNIINSANSNVSYTKSLLNKAREKFNNSALSGMGGIPENWYPVYANPSNWYDIVQDDSQLIKLELDLQSDETDSSSIIVINDSDKLKWKATNSNNETSHLNIDSDKKIKKIYLSVLRVDFIRPWFGFEILDLQNWEIEGLNQCYYSNGKLDQNKGIFPLLTQSILIGTKVSMESAFSPKDISLLTNHNKSGNEISFGPFLFNTPDQNVNINQTEGKTTISSNIKQVVGYLSHLIPVSPALPAG